MQAEYLPYDSEAYLLEDTDHVADVVDVLAALDQMGTDWLETLYTRNETVN